jgi:TatD DNase family protein
VRARVISAEGAPLPDGPGPSLHRTEGLHPWTLGPDRLDLALDDLVRRLPGAVAVGELGLDARRGPPAPAQRAAVRAQLALARERDLPVVLHCVRAHAELQAILRADGLPRRGGLLHGFRGGVELAQAWTALGLHLGVGPAALRRPTPDQAEALGSAPGRWLLTETDAEPGGDALPAVVAALARLRGEPPDAVGDRAAAAAAALFGLPAG